MTVNTILQGVRQFFGMDEEATEQDALDRLNDELESRDAEIEQEDAAAEDNQEDTSAQEEEEHPEEQEEQEEEQTDELAELRQEVADLRQLTESMQSELNKMKELSAGDTTEGKKETPKQGQRSWMNHPMNQKLRRQ